MPAKKEKTKKICLECNKIFQIPNTITFKAREKRKYCSSSCSGKNSLNLFKLGHKSFVNHKQENNPMWKGDNVGYSGLHDWVLKNKKKTGVCSFCLTTKSKRYEWANISKKYKRDLDDFIELCCSCHYHFDRHEKNN